MRRKSAFRAIAKGARLQGEGGWPSESEYRVVPMEQHQCVPFVSETHSPNLMLWTGAVHRWVLEDKPMNDPVPLKFQ